MTNEPILTEQYIRYILFVFGTTSIVLYSPGFQPLISYWDKITEGKLINSLLHCQLCIGFWVSTFSQTLFLQYNGILNYFIDSIICSSISWLLGSIVLFSLWAKAYYEYMVVYKNKI